MSDHSRVFVPIESWSFNSPHLLASGNQIDIGLFAEALIYYDTVIVNVGNQEKFRSFLEWFISQGKYGDLLELINDGTIKIYDYAFISTAIEKDGEFSIWNIQSELEAKPNSFEERFLRHESIRNLISSSRDREKLYKALRDKVIEAKSAEFEEAIENARLNIGSPERNALIVQSFVDELYAFRHLGEAPKVEVAVVEGGAPHKHRITWNVDFNVISKLAGKELNFHLSTPLTAGAHTNRIIWSASSMGCDLYLANPMGTLVGDKLFESSIRVDKTHQVIESLKGEVEFPDIRQLVNQGKIGLDVILEVRKKGERFRRWLQDESDRDRNALIAYHFDVAKESGFTTIGRKSLNLFGVLSGGAIGGALGSAISGPVGGMIGGVAGSAVNYLADIGSKLNSDWKPVAFGNWFQGRIEEVLKKQD